MMIKILDKNGKALRVGDILGNVRGKRYIFLCCGLISPIEEITNFLSFNDFFYKVNLQENSLTLVEEKIIGNISEEEVIYLITLLFYNFPRIVVNYNYFLNSKNKEINTFKYDELFSRINDK